MLLCFSCRQSCGLACLLHVAAEGGLHVGLRGEDLGRLGYTRPGGLTATCCPRQPKPETRCLTHTQTSLGGEVVIPGEARRDQMGQEGLQQPAQCGGHPGGTPKAWHGACAVTVGSTSAAWHGPIHGRCI